MLFELNFDFVFFFIKRVFWTAIL